jgi:hypothetical protein
MTHPASPRTVVLLLALGLAGWLTAPASAADWAVQPADNALGAGRSELRWTLNPGGRLEDGVRVSNAATAPLRVTLRVPRWVAPARDVTVAPGAAVTVPLTLALPRDAAPGDHAGAVVVRAGGGEASVPVRLRVGGPLRPSVAVEGVRVDHTGGDATVRYTIRNTGNAILAARPTVSVSGPLGFGRQTEAPGASPAILPGRRWTGSARVPDVPAAGRLTASVGVLPLLTDAAGSTSALPEVKASGHAWAVPWLPAAALVVLVGLAAVLLGRRARRATYA